MNCCQRRLLLVLVGLEGLVMPVRGADKAMFTMSIAEFRQFSQTDQKTLLISAFKHRLDHAKNIYCEVQIHVGNYECQSGQVGKRLFPAHVSNYRHWRLGESYRMDTQRAGPDDAKPNRFISSGFDSDAGVGKSTIRSSASNRVFGRIDVIPDRITEENRYAYWLDGKHVPMGEYLFRYLIDHKDKYAINTPIGKDTVQLIVPWTPVYSDKPLGTREFILDPQKGFLPVLGKARWETKLSNGKPSWRKEEFVVEASKLVGDVWMPMKLKELIGGSPLGANEITIWETNVTKIEWGTVKPKDLEIPFPKGMEVVDAIKGWSYVVGANDEPAKVERLVGARATAPLPRERPRKVRNPNLQTALIGVGFLVVAVVMLAWKLFRRKRAKVEG